MTRLRSDSSFRIGSSLALAAGIIGGLFTFAACGQNDEGVDVDSPLAADGRPSSVPANYRLTPLGFSHPDCVHEIADDEQVRGLEIHGRHDGRWRRHIDSCAHPRFSKNGDLMDATIPTKIAVPSGTDPLPSIPGGWQADVRSVNQGALSSATAHWNVPNRPNTRSSQVLYLFPGATPPGQEFIIQPVLAWNEPTGPGNSWSMASWFCCEANNTFHSASITAGSYQDVAGSMTGSGCNTSTGSCTWDILSSNLSTGQSTSLHVGPLPAVTNFYGAAVEAYRMDKCANFPSSNAVFSQIRSTPVSLWSPVDPLFQVEAQNGACGMSFDTPTWGGLGFTTTAARR